MPIPEVIKDLLGQLRREPLTVVLVLIGFAVLYQGQQGIQGEVTEVKVDLGRRYEQTCTMILTLVSQHSEMNRVQFNRACAGPSPWQLPIANTLEADGSISPECQVAEIRSAEHGVEFYPIPGAVETIQSARDGIVAEIANGFVRVQDKDIANLFTTYKRVKQTSLKAGEEVQAGQAIGEFEATAEEPFLHFGVWFGWRGVPVDPLLYLPDVSALLKEPSDQAPWDTVLNLWKIPSLGHEPHIEPLALGPGDLA